MYVIMMKKITLTDEFMIEKTETKKYFINMDLF